MNSLKRISFLFLSIVMIFCLCTSTFASSPSSGTYLNGGSPEASESGAQKFLNDSVQMTLDADTANLLKRDSGALDAAFAGKEVLDSKLNEIDNSVDNLWGIIKDVVTWLISFGIITSILVMLFNFVKLALAPSHPIQRRNCMEQIVVSIVCIVLLGGLDILLEIFYGTFAQSLSTGLLYVKDWRYPATVFLAQYGNLIAGFSGIASLTMLLCLGWNFTSLALSGGNPQKKQKALTGIAITTVATIGVGGITTFVSLLVGLL